MTETTHATGPSHDRRSASKRCTQRHRRPHAKKRWPSGYGVSRSTVAVALNHDDADRYQKTLAGIIEVFAGYSIRRQVRYTIEEK